MTVAAATVAKMLGITAGTTRELDVLVQRGLPKASLDRTIKWIMVANGPAGVKDFRAQIVPLATWKRRKTRLSAGESERTERLARVAALTRMIWAGDDDAAREWLNTRHPELQNTAPVRAALTEIGARRVEELLAKIFYGLPA